MVKTKREIVVDIWKTNPFAIAWKKKLNRNKENIMNKCIACSDGREKEANKTNNTLCQQCWNDAECF